MTRVGFLASILLKAATLALSVAPAAAQSHAEQMRRINMSTLGIAAGRTEGAPLRFTAELARVLDDGDRMRLLPIVTRGPFENITDLLFLRGVDMAVVYGDVLDHYSKSPPTPGFINRINYISHLFPSEVHIFARPEITKLEDLAGKPVNFNTKGTAAAYSGPIIFDRLGIKVDARFDPHPAAMAEMVKGDKYAATVWVSTKPLDPFLRRQWPAGFKFLPVPMTPTLEQYYVPAQLDAADYPQLIPAGKSIETISVPALLAVYAWGKDGDRYQRVAKFIDYLVDRLPQLQSASDSHPRWKELNLAAAVPGWRRFPAMQAKLDALAAQRQKPEAAATVASATAPGAARPAVAAARPRAVPIPARARIEAVPAKTPGTPARQKARLEPPLSKAKAEAALASAGFPSVDSLRLDERRFWVGAATQDNQRVTVAVDRRGTVYSRKPSGQVVTWRPPAKE